MSTHTLTYSDDDLPEVEEIEYASVNGNRIFQVGDFTFDTADDDEDYIEALIFANIAWLRYLRENF